MTTERAASSSRDSGESPADLVAGVEPFLAVRKQLEEAGIEVDSSPLTVSLFSSDASVYRVPPRGVVFPRSNDDVESTIRACRKYKVPITCRGAGTSIAGNAIGPGLIIDNSRHLNAILHIDPDARSARVQPGVAHATLQRAAAPHGLRFGPDPSSHSRCTIGGMIGNNACGSRALGYGRTSDNVLGLHLLTMDGEHIRTGTLADPGEPDSPKMALLRTAVHDALATIRTEFGRFGRQVSGYSLEHLLPEKGFDLTKAMVGSEGTLAVILEADVRLVEDAAHRIMVVLGFDSMIEAARAVPSILAFDPIACEGLDRRITDVVAASRGPHGVPPLPQGSGWLMVELVGAEGAALRSAAEEVTRASGALGARIVESAPEIAALWKIREDGSGLVARTPDGRPAHAGWEDAAVPPARLADYLAEFEQLLDQHGLYGVPYGHFGDGCVHVRIDFDLDDPGGTTRYQEFLHEAARLVGTYGGSISGEHGDGRARSELLTHMYSPAAIGLFGAVKRIFDPEHLLNPGVIVDPAGAAHDVRYSTVSAMPLATQFIYPHDTLGLVEAVHRCTGVGRCVAPNPSAAVMCPSFQATRDEKDSTRGRARVLQDAVAGHLGPHGLRSDEVHEALDLCLACKGCKSDCPTGVDMATYKAEVLDARYRGRIRPRSHYSLGQLPRWLRAAQRAPWLFNRVGSAKTLSGLMAWSAGIDPRRSIPTIASRARRNQWRAVAHESVHDSAGSKDVVIFTDTFTDNFSPDVASATLRLLRGAGYRVHVPPKSVCCGLTWVSTGQLDGAKRQLLKTVDVLEPYVVRGMKIIGMEPSCVAALRSDLPELIDSDAARAVSTAVVTLAELMADDTDIALPDLRGTHVLAQPHCHHHAVMGWEADRKLLERCGATVEELGGCCGLAGNFGAERGHYEVSEAVAETQLLPAIRRAEPGTVVLADGFSCRTQLEHFSSQRGVHLAELLKDGNAHDR